MSIRSLLGYMRRGILSSVYCRSATMLSNGPVVSFSFDDFPRTAYSLGGGILRSFGVRGTFYAAPGLINSTNDLGAQMTPGDIDSLLADGHELGSHTFSHASCRRVGPDEFETDAIKGREVLQKMTGQEIESFSFPFGHVTMTAKKTIGPQMSSCRSIYGGVNGTSTDLNLLRANSLYGHVEESGFAQSLLYETVRRNAWLIFYTHDVRSNPSPFGCTPELFENVVAFTMKLGIPVLPVEKVVNRSFKQTSKQPT